MHSKYAVDLTSDVELEALENSIKAGEIPKHIAIIMDGNRRYAKETTGSGYDRGHRLGRDKLRDVAEWCGKLSIKYLTVYAFSIENFKRDPKEVAYIMGLLEESLYRFADNDEVHKNGISINVIGDKTLLSKNILKAIDYAEERTKHNHSFFLNIAIAYGGRRDIMCAIRQMLTDYQSGKFGITDLSEDMISKHLSTRDVPDPDLIIRTSGELRVSNFLLWQMAYSELYFTDTYWPAFSYKDFLRSIHSYQQRNRRFGI